MLYKRGGDVSIHLDIPHQESMDVADLSWGGRANGKSTAEITTAEGAGKRCLGFRVILSAGTRPLKHLVLELVTDEPRRAALRKEPREHRRDFLSQLTES
jgi:hypothetical protein